MVASAPPNAKDPKSRAAALAIAGSRALSIHAIVEATAAAARMARSSRTVIVEACSGYPPIWSDAATDHSLAFRKREDGQKSRPGSTFCIRLLTK